MQLFDDIIGEIKAYQMREKAQGNLREVAYSRSLSWPDAGNYNLVLQSDTGLELGHPSLESVALHLWTQDMDLIKDNKISVIGPDIAESTDPILPFGKIILVGGSGFNEENAHDRYREINLARFDLSLAGYMMRGTSQYMREWSRISRDALSKGFSFSTLGSSLISHYKKIDYISAVEILFITTSNRNVFETIKPLAEKAVKISNAMSKMTEEMSFDCDDCEYEEICSEVAAIRNMRKTRQKIEA
jgi:CO dehydrogenase/acetyl-CoA synthase beta subunit